MGKKLQKRNFKKYNSKHPPLSHLHQADDLPLCVGMRRSPTPLPHLLRGGERVPVLGHAMCHVIQDEGGGRGCGELEEEVAVVGREGEGGHLACVRERIMRISHIFGKIIFKK